MGDQDQQNGEGQSDQQSQGDGQSSAADSQSDTGQSSTTQQTHSAGSGQAQTPGLPATEPAGAYRLSLTEAQRKKLVEEGVLNLSEEQYTGGVLPSIKQGPPRYKGGHVTPGTPALETVRSPTARPRAGLLPRSHGNPSRFLYPPARA